MTAGWTLDELEAFIVLALNEWFGDYVVQQVLMFTAGWVSLEDLQGLREDVTPGRALDCTRGRKLPARVRPPFVRASSLAMRPYWLV